MVGLAVTNFLRVRGIKFATCSDGHDEYGGVEAAVLCMTLARRSPPEEGPEEGLSRNVDVDVNTRSGA